jgi:predicted DNA repair protein MutK
VWAVTKGSFVNKAILVPAALLISAFAPRMIVPLLMIGGLYLCFEGFEKIAKKLLHAKEEAAHKAALHAALADTTVDLVALERDRIKGAIRTDFILSAEIVVIALGTMATAPLREQVVALTLIAILITVLVYGLVAGIVKLDDLGLRLHAAGGPFKPFGAMILRLAPVLMRTLGVVGTAAMFMVGGSIIVHGIPALEHVVEGAVHAVVSGGIVAMLTRTVLDAFVGVVAGGLVVAVVSVPRLFKRGEPTLPAAH